MGVTSNRLSHSFAFVAMIRSSLLLQFVFTGNRDNVLLRPKFEELQDKRSLQISAPLSPALIQASTVCAVYAIFVVIGEPKSWAESTFKLKLILYFAFS